MDRETFRRFAKEFRGVATAVKKAGDGHINGRVLKCLDSITVERIDYELLATTLIGSNEWDEHSDYTILKSWWPTFYIVQDGGSIHEYRPRAGTATVCRTNDWTEDYSVSCEEEEDDSETEPLALYFEAITDVRHVLICSVHKVDRELESLSITVYKLPAEFDLSTAVQKVLDVWRREGRYGLEQFWSGPDNESKSFISARKEELDILLGDKQIRL